VWPFAPRFELWSDGAEKRRWIYLPPGTQIDSSDPDAWIFPPGTKLWKEFTRDGVRVETRLLFKHGSEASAWTLVPYVWGGDGDAWQTPEGLTNALATRHEVPSASQCTGCHGGTRSAVLGFSAVQLPWFGEGGAVGLADLVGRGRLTDAVIRTEIPGDATTRAALGYLHVNCSHCHNQQRPDRSEPCCFNPQSPIDFSLRTRELDEPASTATYRTAIGEVFLPGYSGDSNAMQRVRSRDPWWGMPALGTEQIDHEGVQLLERWIGAL
jgi:hypothetical protein